MQYLVTFTAQVEADNEEEAIDRADAGKGGGHWEAHPINDQEGTEEHEVRKIETRDELIEFARELGMRPDWHEPDEQGITARAFGTSFDNAGFWPKDIDPGYTEVRQEMFVVLYRTEWGDDGEISERVPIAAVNLATLFAWATGHDTPRPERVERAQVRAMAFREAATSLEAWAAREEAKR